MLAFAPTSAGLVSIPKYPFREQKEDFTFVSLLTRPEVITALSKVRAECNKVTSMSLFHSSLSKYSRLEEFEQIQSQTFSQVPGHQSMEDGASSPSGNNTASGPAGVGQGWSKEGAQVEQGESGWASVPVPLSQPWRPILRESRNHTPGCEVVAAASLHCLIFLSRLCAPSLPPPLCVSASFPWLFLSPSKQLWTPDVTLRVLVHRAWPQAVGDSPPLSYGSQVTFEHK